MMPRGRPTEKLQVGGITTAVAAEMKPNRHIVDQLAEVCARLQALKARETALKDQISAAMGPGNVLVGDDFSAVQKITERAGSI